MTKTQFIELIATRAPHVPQREVEALVNAVFDLMGDALRRGERIEIRGFGCFAIRTREPRVGRNPKTGVQVLVPKRQTLSFTVGKELRERIHEASVRMGLIPASESVDGPDASVVDSSEAAALGAGRPGRVSGIG